MKTFLILCIAVAAAVAKPQYGDDCADCVNHCKTVKKIEYVEEYEDECHNEHRWVTFISLGILLGETRQQQSISRSDLQISCCSASSIPCVTSRPGAYLKVRGGWDVLHRL